MKLINAKSRAAPLPPQWPQLGPGHRPAGRQCAEGRQHGRTRYADPHNASGTWENRILGDMFLGLTTEAADGSVIPGAAETWTVSEDGTVYTLRCAITVVGRNTGDRRRLRVFAARI